MNNLRNSLEEFEISEGYETKVTLATIMQLGSMPKLKVLNYYYNPANSNMTLIEQKAYVKDNLPHLSINKKSLAIGLHGRDNPENGFWEIQSKQLKIFDYHWYHLAEENY